MINVTAAQQTVLESRVAGMGLFVSLAFTSTTLRVSTLFNDQTWGGFTWLGAAKVGSITEVKDTEKFESNPIDMILNVADATLLSLALTDANAYRGKTAIIYLAPMQDNVLIGTPMMCWNGFMDTMAIQYNADGGGSIAVRCKPTTDRLNRASGLRANAQQQALINSSDRGFDYLTSLITQPQLWISKRFQEV